MERQKKEYEERLEVERIALEERRIKEEEERLLKQRTADEEAEQLLDAYRRKQEELLEKERRFEEEMALRERELEEKTRKRSQTQRDPVEEVVTLVQDNQSYSAAPGPSLQEQVSGSLLHSRF